MTELLSQPEVILDLSRLLSRVFHPTPTGVDRCEMAYARGLLRDIPDRLSFAAQHPMGIHGRLPRTAVERFLDLMESRWEDRGFIGKQETRRFAWKSMVSLIPRPWLSPGNDQTQRFYLQASPNNLTDQKLISSILRRQRASFICLLHDLIPLQYPEYARPNGAEKHASRIRTIAALADGIVANSQATLNAFLPYLDNAKRRPAVAVAHLGTNICQLPTGEMSDRSYFVCVGTIEPRKNHLLLLNIWRQLSAQFGAAAIPKLVIIGRRGWENEQVVDMLERCTALRGCVEEISGLPNGRVHNLVAGSRALLLPSFAEGYGMPVAEALAAGVPVVCSDLPALREAGGDVPVFLDPLDGPAWRAAILDLANDTSDLRKRHVSVLREWGCTSWESHLAIVRDLMHRLTACQR